MFLLYIRQLAKVLYSATIWKCEISIVHLSEFRILCNSFFATLLRELQSIDYSFNLHNLNRHKTYFKNIYQILIFNY